MGSHASVVRYVLAGAGNASINFGLFLLLYHVFGVWYVFASVAGYTARLLFKFFCMRFWVFGGVRDGSHLGRFMRFAAIEGGLYLLSLPVLVVLVDVLGVLPPYAVLACIALFYGIGFFAMRRIFHPQRQ